MAEDFLKQKESDFRQEINRILDSLPPEAWGSDGLAQIKLKAKEAGFYTFYNFTTLLKIFRQEVRKRMPPEEEARFPFLFLEIKRLDNETFHLSTSKGNLIISSKDLFNQSSFRQRVASTFGIFLRPMPKDIWEQKLEEIFKKLVDSDEDTKPEEIIEEALRQFLSEAEERDWQFLRKGLPIIHDGKFHFRLHDFLRFLRSDFEKNFTRPICIVALRNLGWEPDRLSDEFRTWSRKV